MIRVLHVVSVMDVGGMESFIMNLYRGLDRSEIQFDFLVHHRRRGAFEDEIEGLGGQVYHTSLMDDGNFPRYRLALRRLFRQHPEYRIVHGHLGSTALWYLGEAERQGVPWRILHSHCPGHIHSLKGDAKHILFYFSPRHANIRLACSEEAGKYQFKRQSFEVIPNGIDVSRFRFDESQRNALRSRLGIQGRFVIGHVGRFYYEKNHPFILKAFQGVKAQAPEALLLLVGDGVLMEKTKAMAKEMGIDGDVLFMGLQQDPAPWYQAMDAFILPSLYEGMPLTGIEAQCAGLPCLFSSTVSSGVKLSERSVFLPIGEEHLGRWVDALAALRYGETGGRPFPSAAWAYDAAHVTRAMTDRYVKLLEMRP